MSAPAPEHRPILSVDRTNSETPQRHILIPVDDTDVRGCLDRNLSCVHGWIAVECDAGHLPARTSPTSLVPPCPGPAGLGSGDHLGREECVS